MWFGPDFVCEERNNGEFLLSKYCEGGVVGLEGPWRRGVGQHEGG